MPDIVSELLKLQSGTAKCVLGATFHDLRQRLELLSPDLRRPIVLLTQIEAIPSASQLIGDVLSTLATTARNLWPVWFTDVDFGLGISAGHRAQAQARISRIHERVPGLSPLWGRKAIDRILAGEVPIFTKLPRTTQLHQLRLAISRTGLVLVIALPDAKHSEGSLLALANAVLWLARNAKLAVAVLLPADMHAHPALAHILYDTILFERLGTAGRAKTTGFNVVLEAADGGGHGTVWVWMGEGRTHPHSAGEARLAKALLDDLELCQLFSANRPVETIYRSRPTVDLLWPEGRVVVEVDGHDHRTPQKYATDRRRDFELGISDYYVLRLLNDEIMTDTAKAIAQIREVVRYRRRTRPDLGRRL